jgi:hypothetical protein
MSPSSLQNIRTLLFMQAQTSRITCVGLRPRTARAIAVVVSGTMQSPQIVARTQLTLCAPDQATLHGPYHEVMDLPWDQAVRAVQVAEREIEALATSRLKDLLLDLRTRGIDITHLAIVGAPDRKLQSIGNPHIRAHAAEGVLFRHVWQAAADSIGIPSLTFTEKDFEAFTCIRLQLGAVALRNQLAAFGSAIGRPWRSDEKFAAMAAWLALEAGIQA